MTKVTHLTLDEDGSLARRRIHLREISDHPDTPLETVGQDLRAARMRRGDDLATASKALKIRKDHLEALEEDRFEALPGRTYAIGFVRSYAEYLGLDAIEAVERFKIEIAGRDEAPGPPAFHDSGDERRLPHGWIVIALVVLGVVVYGAYRLARSANSLLSEPVTPVPSRMVSEQKVPDTAPPPAAAAPAAAPVPARQQASAPPSTQPAPTAANPPPPAKTTPATQAPPNSAAPDESATAGQAALPPQGRVYGLHNTDARVIIHALEPARILVMGGNGAVYINRILQAGDSYRVPDRVGLTLSTPNSGALAIELDGQMMGRAGTPNQIVEAASLDPQAIVDRFTHGRAQ